jgi:hypothetical protein
MYPRLAGPRERTPGIHPEPGGSPDRKFPCDRPRLQSRRGLHKQRRSAGRLRNDDVVRPLCRGRSLATRVEVVQRAGPRRVVPIAERTQRRPSRRSKPRPGVGDGLPIEANHRAGRGCGVKAPIEPKLGVSGRTRSADGARSHRADQSQRSRGDRQRRSKPSILSLAEPTAERTHGGPRAEQSQDRSSGNRHDG